MKNVWILIFMMGMVTLGYGQDIGEEIKDKRVLSIKAQAQNGNVNPVSIYYYCHDTRTLTLWVEVSSNIPIESSQLAYPLDRFLIVGSGYLTNNDGLLYEFRSESDLSLPVMRSMNEKCDYCPNGFPMVESIKIEFDLSEFVDENNLDELTLRSQFTVELGLGILFTSSNHYPMTATWSQERFVDCDELWPQDCFSPNSLNLSITGSLPECQDEIIFGLEQDRTRVVNCKGLDIDFYKNHIMIVDVHGRIKFEIKEFSGSISDLPNYGPYDKVILYESLEEYILRSRN